MAMKTWAEAEPGPDFYYAVLRDGPYGRNISHCPHRHRTREAAEQCAERMRVRTERTQR